VAGRERNPTGSVGHEPPPRGGGASLNLIKERDTLKEDQGRNFEKLWDEIREYKAREKREKLYTTYSCDSYKRFRRCNTCGNIYDKRDFNKGYCPVCRIFRILNGEESA
jgi:hypothetical protein